jgi:hypothetical protein
MKRFVAALIALCFASGSFACAVGHAASPGTKGTKPAASKVAKKKAVKPQAPKKDARAEAAAQL